MAFTSLNDKYSNARIGAIWLLPIILAGCQTATPERDLDRYLQSAAREDRGVVAGGGSTNIITNSGEPARMDGATAVAVSKALRADGRAREAVDTLEGTGAKARKDPLVDLELGRAKINAGDAQGAIAPLRRYVENQPGDWRGAVALGVALDLAGRNGESMPHYERALRLSPGNPAVLNNMALSKALAGDLNGATRLLSEVSEDSAAPEKVRGNLELVRQLNAGNWTKGAKP